MVAALHSVLLLQSPELANQKVEALRTTEYAHLNGTTYLDHAGTAIYARSACEEFTADLTSNLYGNPHSASTPSFQAGQRVDQIRERALRFLNADPQVWDLVFVANATAAIKLLVECFRDHAGATKSKFWYAYHRDAHTSLVGGRELACKSRCFQSDAEVDHWVAKGCASACAVNLFAYPGQSNMTGRRLPQVWSRRIREQGRGRKVYTLLDAAALASTSPLPLTDVVSAPDFVALSFYKIFGFPNVGALLVQKRSAHMLLNRQYFGGGTVEMVINSAGARWHAKKNTSIHDRLEDGTLPFHSIFALDHAMNVHERLYGPNPMAFISFHTANLAQLLHEELSALNHTNGQPLVHAYLDNPTTSPGRRHFDSSTQGATISFALLDPMSNVHAYTQVEKAADLQRIYVRSGSLCNPGGVAKYLRWSATEMRQAYAAGHRCSKPVEVLDGKPTGVVRVSLGCSSTRRDVEVLVEFVRREYTDRPSVVEIDQQSLSTTHKQISMDDDAKACLPMAWWQRSLKRSRPRFTPLRERFVDSSRAT